jgi:multidrug efflux pump subunit AcrA (membrane-fusion protein)
MVEAEPLAVVDHAVTLTGYATVSSAQTLAVSPQVGGRVLAVAPALEEGEVIAAGTELYRIDDRDYHLQIELNDAQAKRLRADIARLRQDIANIADSLAIRREQLALSQRESVRLAELAKTAGLVTATEVDIAAKQILADREAIQNLENQARVLPLQIAALDVEIDRLDRSSDLHRLTIERCVMRMPFTGRVLSADLEAGQIVAPGQVVAVLVDDSQLEISVPLDAREVRDFLGFQEGMAGESGWFPPPERVSGLVTWVDAAGGPAWPCTVQRIATFDRSTRTVHVLVTLDPTAPELATNFRPVSGMFCRVDIPGGVRHDVFEIPRAALRANSKVYVVAGDQLAYRAVTILREIDESVIVRGELAVGDRVITSKLTAPLEGIYVQVRALPTAPVKPAPATEDGVPRS